MGLRKLLLFFIWFFAIVSCGRQEKPVIVAQIGEQSISLLEFRLAYMEFLKQPRVFDSKENREEFLKELVRRKLLAREARKRNIRLDETQRGQVEAYYEKALREAHYKEVIEPQISIDSLEAKAIYSYTRQQRKLKHLFFKTKYQADSAYTLLDNGYDWNQLAKNIFNKSILSNTGGELGWISWDQLEYPLAMAAFGQKKGTFTRPVKSTFGYHILFIEDLKIDPFITEEDFKLNRRKVIKLIRAKKGESLAADYIKKRMAKVQLQVNPRVMRLVGQRLKTILRRSPSMNDYFKKNQITEVELQNLQKKLRKIRNEALAYIDGQPLTVAKFIHALNYVPYQYVQKSFKTALDFVIRDQVLTREAREMHLDEKYPFVRYKKQILEDYFLQLKLRKSLAGIVQVDSIEIKDHAQAHEKQFRNTPYDSLALKVSKIIANKKRINRLASFVDSLQQNQNIRLFPENIHEYYKKLINGEKG